jgi:hypothetical protein
MAVMLSSALREVGHVSGFSLLKPRGLATALTVGAGLLGAPGSGVLAPALATAGAAQAAVTQPAVTAAAVTPSGGTLNAVLPQRILDTRTTTGGHHGKLGSGATMRLAVLDEGGVPGAGVSAVLLNVTAVGETASAGYLAFYRTGISRPPTSTLDYRAGVPVANLALVPVGPDGTVSIFNSVGQTTTMKPARILDTRTAIGGHHGSLGSGQSLKVAVEGAGGIPAAGVSAVYADIAAVPVGNAAGNLTAYPSDAAPPPLSSTVNFMAGVTTANLVLLPVSATGTITITIIRPRPT